MAVRTLRLSETCVANTEVAWAPSETTGFHNGQREPHVVLSHAAVLDCGGSCQENMQLTIPPLGTVAGRSLNQLAQQKKTCLFGVADEKLTAFWNWKRRFPWQQLLKTR